MASLPEIIILSIKRIDWILNIKNNTEIKFSEYLNLRRYIDNDFEKNNEESYSLIGIINHIGSLEFGHYYSLIKLNGDVCINLMTKMLK